MKEMYHKKAAQKNPTAQERSETPVRETVEYQFHFPNSDCKCCHVIGGNTTSSEPRKHREWTQLDYHKCSHCPLQEKETAVCPAADGLSETVEQFSNFRSYDDVKILIRRNSVEHVKSTDLQTALAYYFPAVVGYSDCPYAYLLTPWLRFGKPFPDIYDIYFLAAAFVTLSKSFNVSVPMPTGIQSAEKEPAFLLALTFHGLLERIRSDSNFDANINGIVKDIQWSYVALHPPKEIRERLMSLFESNS